MDNYATSTTDEITVGRVRDWARDAISGWFTGHAGTFSEEEFQRYCVHMLSDGTFQFDHRDYAVPSRRFDVAVVVVERLGT